MLRGPAVTLLFFTHPSALEHDTGPGHPERIARAMDLASFGPRDPAVSRSRRLGLAAAQSYRDEMGHLDVPADYTDPTGYTLGAFITTMRDAAKAGRLEADWIAELEDWRDSPSQVPKSPATQV